MRDTTNRLCLGLILLAGFAAGKGTPAKEIRENGTASAAYVQDHFVSNLGINLGKHFNKARGKKMLAAMTKQEFSGNDVLDLMNGTCTDKELRQWFGAKRAETDRIRKALDAAVDAKDRSGFFGIMNEVMIGDFSMDPSAEFAKQACGAKDAMSPESMNKLRAGNISKRTVKEAFGFKDKDDVKHMQEIIRRMNETDFFTHPMLKSLGMGKGKSFSPRKFQGKLNKNNAGFESFEDGTAGGLPVDPKLPPFPYFGDNLEKHFK